MNTLPARGNVNRQSTVDTAPDASVPAVPARRRVHRVGVHDVIRETADAVSLVLDVSPADASVFAYRPGQFLNVRVEIDGEPHVRSYSMSSSPDIDRRLRVTVKRVAGGLVSNWIHDRVRVGDQLEVMPPAGSFVLDDAADPIVAFAAGSGITPVFSIVNTALTSTDRRVVLCYANRDRDATIFAGALDDLCRQHPDRLTVRHHHDVEHGFVTADTVAEVIATQPDGRCYVCGPTPFMHVVETTLLSTGVAADRIHVERFTPAEPSTHETGAISETDTTGESDTSDESGDPVEADAPGAGDAPVVTVHLGRQRADAVHRPGTTILQTARTAGLRAPSSCETGSCATCMARVTEGRVEMRNNEALTPDEVDEGWVLTCQSVPVTPTVTVVYD